VPSKPWKSPIFAELKFCTPALAEGKYGATTRAGFVLGVKLSI